MSFYEGLSSYRTMELHENWATSGISMEGGSGLLP